MARIELTKQLADFTLVVGKMRELGVAQWVCSPVGDLTLGPPPLIATRASKADKDPKAQRRIYYSEVLGRAVTDVELENLP